MYILLLLECFVNIDYVELLDSIVQVFDILTEFSLHFLSPSKRSTLRHSTPAFFD